MENKTEDDRAQQLLGRYELLQSERRNLDQVYELISRFCVPGRGRFFRKGNDSEESVEWRHRELYDSTAVHACQTLSANIHGSLTSPATRWFNLRFKKEELNDNVEASRWIEEAQDIIFYSLTESNFNLEANELYLDDVSYGTAVMFHEIDSDGKFKFRTAMTREVYFEEDFDGSPMAIYRKREYTPRQLIDRFDDGVPDDIRSTANSAKATVEKIEVVHAIVRHDDFDDIKTDKILPPDRRPYQEYWILVKGGKILNQKPNGYYEMPAYVLRWGRTAGSKFGYSPAINVMSDILTLNQLVEFTLKAAEKVIDPPVLSRQRGVVGDLDLFPGGNTIVRDPRDVVPFESKARFDVSNIEREKLIETIRQAFFVDQLELKQSPAMTATEVNVRYELMQRLLGPALSRMQSDFLDPLIHRSFWGLHRQGLLPPMPDIVKQNQGELDVEYVGALARWQKMNEVNATERWLTQLSQMAAVSQDVLDVVDFEQVARNNAKQMGVPAEVLRSKEEVKQLRKAREKEQAQAQQTQQAIDMAGAMKDGADAEKSMAQAGAIQ